MIAATAALVPLATALLFGGAIAAMWRRRRTPHALAWSTAFLVLALGWTVVLLETALDLHGAGVDAAPRLCWLAAALLFVQGLRTRAGRRPRGDVLAAIWGAVAFAVTAALGIMPHDGPPIAAMLSILVAIGTGLAAVAVGPRAMLTVAPRTLRIEWAALLLLGGYAVFSLSEAVWTLALPAALPEQNALAAWAAVATIGIGLAALLILNADLVTALERLARTDPLTNIWNRRGFDEAAHHLLDRQAPGFGPIAAVTIADIDAFKSINDRFGHAVGDAVLARFAEMLKLAVQPGDLLARLGGEEFALLAFCSDGHGLLARVERVRAAMASLGPDNGAPLPITASFGVAELSSTGHQSLRDALERADKALYRAKSEGRNRAILDPGPRIDPGPSGRAANQR